MARKTATVLIEDAGRDQGKTFLIREMSAHRAERWATRALMALAKAGVQVPDDLAGAGLAGIAAIGMQALGSLSFADAEPLLDEMMACVSVVPSPNVVRPLIEDDIEEVLTRLKLRVEVFNLHTGFSLAASPPTPTPGLAASVASPST